jgi:hypothetical protein
LSEQQSLNVMRERTIVREVHAMRSERSFGMIATPVPELAAAQWVSGVAVGS